jgi:amino acid transporter
MKIEKPNNFTNAFEGTTASASSFCLSLYSVIWSYIGFSNVNYALSEVKDPKRTVRIAGPVAIAVVTVLYLLANIAYFAGASKEEITSSGRLVAALLFRNVYGPRAERALSVLVALSALGNVLSVVRAHSIYYVISLADSLCRSSHRDVLTRNSVVRVSSPLASSGAPTDPSTLLWRA